jgi:hypothetical protein
MVERRGGTAGIGDRRLVWSGLQPDVQVLQDVDQSGGHVLVVVGVDGSPGVDDVANEGGEQMDLMTKAPCRSRRCLSKRMTLRRLPEVRSSFSWSHEVNPIGLVVSKLLVVRLTMTS